MTANTDTTARTFTSVQPCSCTAQCSACGDCAYGAHTTGIVGVYCGPDRCLAEPADDGYDGPVFTELADAEAYAADTWQHENGLVTFRF